MFPVETEQEKVQEKTPVQVTELRDLADEWDVMEVWIGQEPATIAIPKKPMAE